MCYFEYPKFKCISRYLFLRIAYGQQKSTRVCTEALYSYVVKFPRKCVTQHLYTRIDKSYHLFTQEGKFSVKTLKSVNYSKTK